MLDVFRKLGHASRRALWLSEKQTRREVEDAARNAAALDRARKDP